MYKINEKVNTFLLAGDKFSPEIYFKTTQICLQCFWTCLLKTKKEYKILKKQEIHNIFIKTNKVTFNIMWLMIILRIYREEQPLIKHYVLKHLVLLKIQNMMRYQKGFT